MVKVTLKNQAQLLSKRTAPDHHYVSLIIGNSDNTVIFLQKLTWDHPCDVKQWRGTLVPSRYSYICFSGTWCCWGVAAGPRKLRWQSPWKERRSVSISSAQNMESIDSSSLLMGFTEVNMCCVVQYISLYHHIFIKLFFYENYFQAFDIFTVLWQEFSETFLHTQAVNSV